MDVLAIIAGLVMLTLGGEGLVRGSVRLAARLGVSPLIIGVTLVGFGTSTPELVTSVQASLADSPGIAVGNVVGSNIANILLILGVAALIAPIACSRAALRRDGVVMMLATLVGLAIVLTGTLGRPVGLLLVLLLTAYIVFALRSDDAVHSPDEVREMAGAKPPAAALSLLIAVGGLVVTILGARLLVTGAINIARDAGISEAVIGVTVVAVGTSLPELTASVIAGIRRHADVAFGNIIGSNIYNILGILGITALVRPLVVPEEIIALDIWVLLAASLVFILFSVTGRRLSRTEGGLLLAGYGAYLGFLALTV